MKSAVVFVVLFAIALARKSKPRPTDDEDGCSCGWTDRGTSKSENRIVGGISALLNEFPLIAALSVDEFPDMVYCGSTIITKRHAITASHCHLGDDIPLSVVLGEHDTQLKKDSKTVRISVSRFIKHENYDKKNNTENDIALLLLARNIRFRPTIGPACFPDPGYNVLGETVRMIGWGLLKYKGPQANVLQKVDVQVVPNERCDKVYKGIDNSIICTYADNQDSCQGDSGGPVIYMDPNTMSYTVVGVVSHGIGCAEKDTPAVSTSVAYFRDWILEKIHETFPKATVCSNKA